MAVKEKVTTVGDKVTFLSRLCGGEGWVFYGFMARYFLSRLCGGEVVGIIGVLIVIFLSRLCGGEDEKICNENPF